MTRTASPIYLAVGSLIVLAALIAALWWREHQYDPNHRPLIVYAAPTVRLPLEAIATDYERETGQRIELRFGASEDLLTKVRFPNPVEPADLFIPADDSYIRQAQEANLARESFPIARVSAVVLLAKDNPKGIAAWPDLLRGGVKVAVPNPSAAVGKLAREHLAHTGKWHALAPRVIGMGNVTEAANATKVGSADAGIVWDVVAAAPAYRGQTVLRLPELTGVDGRIEIAVLKQSRYPEAARQFARYVAAIDRGLVHFRQLGFRVHEKAEPWSEPQPEGAKP